MDTPVIELTQTTLTCTAILGSQCAERLKYSSQEPHHALSLSYLDMQIANYTLLAAISTPSLQAEIAMTLHELKNNLKNNTKSFASDVKNNDIMNTLKNYFDEGVTLNKTLSNTINKED